MARIKITLKADLCTGSGQGFASIIDTDVSYDRYGLPYIPARRLKGCLREAAVYIGMEDIDAIFGVTGNHQSGSLKLANAYIDGYKELISCLEKTPEQIRPECIKDLFTYTKSQTAIQNGHAQKESLRFLRVIRQFSPLDKKELVFYADCEIGETYKQPVNGRTSMGDLCKALRNIGMNRTRGLGAVECEFEPVEKSSDNPKQLLSSACADDMEYSLQYRIDLLAPLMLPNTANDESATYISGTSILGALSGAYLRKYPKADTLFEDLFLKNKVIFANAYTENTIPAPFFLGKTKSSGQITSVFSPIQGELPKRLRGKFVTADFRIREVKTETIYHHSKGKKQYISENKHLSGIENQNRGSEDPGGRENAGEEILYTQNSICAGQKFFAEIRGKGKYIKEIESLLRQGIRIGRSKSAEYAACDVTVLSCHKPDNRQITVTPRESLIVALESDLLCLDEDGYYTADVKSVFLLLKQHLHLSADTVPDAAYTAVEAGIITGYSGVWNAKKPHLVCVSAGSIFVFSYQGADSGETASDLPASFYLGKKNNEGFGRCRLYKQSDIIGMPDDNENAGGVVQEGIIPPLYNLLKEKIAEAGENEAIRQAAIQFYRAHQKTIVNEFNAALIGRILLITEQSKNYQDFTNRIGSIKAEKKRKAVMALIDKARKEAAIVNEEHYKSYYKLVFTLARYSVKRKEVIG